MMQKASKPKQKPGPRRELAPLEPVDAKDGPAMLALPTDRHRAFVRAMYSVRPGFGAAVRAAKLAGFGTAESSAQTMASIGSRLTHDVRIQAAFAEQDQLHIRAAAPRALRALSHLIEDPRHRDHARALGMVLDRTNPVEMLHKVKHEHEVSSSMIATAEVFKQIMELAARARVPPMIDVTPERSAS
jgi:phage terminase small subunit